ncbi:MAG: hypothetical protein HY590_06550 [Candidatus Omnitrophica bacterium]|nr:hypothetical protein [Candidatus Omnitrophota bacterium]
MENECKICGVHLGQEKEGFYPRDEFYDRVCSRCKGHVCKAHLAFESPPTCTDCTGD